MRPIVFSALALASLCAGCGYDTGTGGYAQQQPVQPYAQPYGYSQPVQPYGYAPGYPSPVYGYAPQYQPTPAFGFGGYNESERRERERAERGEYHEHEVQEHGAERRPAGPPPTVINAPPPGMHAAPPGGFHPAPPPAARPAPPQAAANLESLKRLGFQPNH
ncbi:hypothetical protein [Rhodopila sp.]|uniref:hypothetical protein n=1 Tax=Rhodopila sp. TaxID=2480087 RepID=UPI003D0BA4F8